MTPILSSALPCASCGCASQGDAVVGGESLAFCRACWWQRCDGAKRFEASVPRLGARLPGSGRGAADAGSKGTDPGGIRKDWMYR